MSKPKIALVHPGHAATTAWMYNGYKKYLERLGCEILECRTDKLISIAALMLDNAPTSFEGDQGATADQWKLHMAQQFMLIRIMEMQLQKPDLTLVVCGKLISPQNYMLLDMIPGSKVVMLTESPYEDGAQEFFAQFYDFATVNDRISVPVIGKWLPTAYQPHGYDSEIYFPDPREPELDVSFIGTPFGNRKSILTQLRYAQDLNPFIFDATVQKDEKGTPQVMYVPPDSAARCYNRTKVNLNIHRTEKFYETGDHIANAYSLGPRTFEIAGCGAFQLCDDSRPELREIFGDTVATYHDPAEVVEAVRYWADPARDSLRRDMGLASQQIALKNTYTDRALRLVNQLAAWYNRPEWAEQETYVEAA